MRKKYRRNTAGIWAGEGMPIEAVYLLFLFQDIQRVQVEMVCSMDDLLVKIK